MEQGLVPGLKRERDGEGQSCLKTQKPVVDDEKQVASLMVVLGQMYETNPASDDHSSEAVFGFRPRCLTEQALRQRRPSLSHPKAPSSSHPKAPSSMALILRSPTSDISARLSIGSASTVLIAAAFLKVDTRPGHDEVSSHSVRSIAGAIKAGRAL